MGELLFLGLWTIHTLMPGGCQQGKEKMKAAIMVPGADGGTWDVRDVQRPVVTAGHVLVRVHASSLNRAEFRRLHTLRLQPGRAAPEERTGGGDAAGEVVGLASASPASIPATG